MKKRNFSKWGGLFFSFNFIVGYAFVVGLGQAFATSGIIGFPIILLVCALIAYGVGIAFSILGTKYQGYGGSYQFVKKGFGKKFAFWIGWFNYIQAPFIAVGALAGIVWAFQGSNFFGWNLTTIQEFNKIKMWLFIGTLVWFIILILIVNLGFNSTRFSLWLMWGLKWLVLGASLFFAIGQIIHLAATNQGHQIIDNITGKGFKMQGPLLPNLITSVLTFFFAFGGFEGIAAIADDFENPRKNIRFILTTTIIFATIFYFVYYFVFLGALGVGRNTHSIVPVDNHGKVLLDANPINLVIQQLFGIGSGVTLAILSIGTISQVANKSTSRVQNQWVNTKLLLPLAIDGWLPKWMTRVNKYGQFNRCLLLDSILTMILLCSYTLLAVLTMDPNKSGDGAAGNLSSALSIYTLVAFLNYIGTLVTLFKLWRKKEIVLKLYEKIMCCFSFGAMILILIGFIGQGIFYGVTKAENADAFTQFLFQFIGFGLAIFSGAIIFFLSGFRKWKDQKLHPTFVQYVHANPNSVSEEVLDDIFGNKNGKNMFDIKTEIVNS